MFAFLIFLICCFVLGILLRERPFWLRGSVVLALAILLTVLYFGLERLL